MEEQNEKKRSPWVTVISVLALMWILGSVIGNKDDKSRGVPAGYEWVVGIWTCETPYGIYTYSLGKNGSFSDNEGHAGTFSIEAGRIYTRLDGTLGFAIEVDERNKRIGPGEGYWMYKISK